MFFRRERPKQLGFQERLDTLKKAGFTVAPLAGTRVRVSRDGCAAVLESASEMPRLVERPGVLMGEEIGSLTDGGFQKFLQTPSGKRKPALAAELKALHSFQEDMREAMGMVSLYNESLGTVSNFYLYDRLTDRDAGVPKRAWES